MRLIIHAGFHKTGTSAIQAFCRLNRSRLAKKGILYPEEGTANIKYPGSPTAEAGHRRLEIIFSSPTNRSSKKKLRSIIDELKFYDDVHTVLVSSETFSAPKIHISPAILHVLEEYFSEVRVLIYLRRQDDWADSFYREVLCWSRKREQGSFEKFYERLFPDWLDYEKRLEKWGGVFGNQNLILKSFDDRSNKNVILDFFSELGLEDLPDSEFLYPTGVNISLPSDLIPLMLDINALELSPNQRSTVTQRIYRELAESEYQVNRQSLFTQKQIDIFHQRFHEVNKRICRKYEISNCAYFCYKQDRSTAPTENSLNPKQVREIGEFALQLNTGESAFSGPRHERENKGRFGISCLINEDPRQVKIFVNYHLALGASRIRLYFDNPDDAMAGYDFGTEKVEAIRCTSRFWESQAGGEPDTNDDKLYICHEDGLNYLNSREDIDWAINIDADELIYMDIGNSVQSYLRNISEEYDQVRICPLENIFVSDADMELFSSRYFKVPRVGSISGGFNNKNVIIRGGMLIVGNLIKILGRVKLFRLYLLKISKIMGIYLFWSRSDEMLYKKHMPELAQIMRQGFLGHRRGRTFTRHGVLLDEMSSHVPGSSLKKLKVKKFGSKMFLLHYDAASYPAWHLKWHRRTYGDTTANVIGGDRQKQQDMFLEASEQGEVSVKGLFLGFFRLPEPAVREFEQAGLIVKLKNPLLEKVKLELKD